MSSFRSQIACRFAAEAVASQGRCYLWTFTTGSVVTGRQISEVWQAFSERMMKEFPGWSGVRVFELHPGGHGWHVHFVTGRYVWVRLARRVAQLAGFGRIHVKRVAASSAGYVAKYVSKSAERDPGMRLWAVVGKKALQSAGVAWSRVCNIVWECEEADVVRRAWAFVSQLTGNYRAKAEFVSAEVMRWICDRPSAVPMDYRTVCVDGRFVLAIECSGEVAKVVGGSIYR